MAGKWGRVVGPTYRIINQPVGEGQPNARADVIRIQRLLNRAGYNLGEDGGWGGKSRAALLHFLKNWREDACYAIHPGEVAKLENYQPKGQMITGIGMPIPEGSRLPRHMQRPRFILTERGAGGLLVQPWLGTDDKALFALAQAAGTILKLSKKTRVAAFREVLDRVVGLPYRGYDGIGQPHMFWGLNLKGYEDYGIITGDFKNRAKGRGYQFLKKTEPMAFHCTSFATVMMAVWQQGNCRKAPYDAHTLWGGARLHLAAEWDWTVYRPDGKSALLRGSENLLAAFKGPADQLYLVELASRAQNWKVVHYAFVLNDSAYHASLLQRKVVKVPLKAWAEETSKTRGFYVWGPSF